MFDATLCAPDLGKFCGLDGLGLKVVWQKVSVKRAELSCVVAARDDWCRRCGAQGVVRDSVTRCLSHTPLGWRPTILLVQVPRIRCATCKHVWRQDLSLAAGERAKLSRAGLRWALEALVCQHLTVARIAEALDVSWGTANQAVLDA